MYKNINYQVKDSIGTIKINRPEAMNSLNYDTLEELNTAFQEIANDSAVRSIILTGEGKAFVAGADIAAMSEMSAAEGREMMKKGHQLMNLMESIEKPIIAAVNGFALGGGCELALACDFRIASEKAKFGQPEVNLGIIPGFGGTQRLPRLVGKSRGKLMIMTGDLVAAKEALEIGLCDKVVAPEELIIEAESLARKIMSKAPLAIGTAKTVINIGYDLDMKSATALEMEGFTGPFASDDKKEGMEAFLNKREADFKGK